MDSYEQPIRSNRTAYSHRFDGYSSKLARPITLLSYDQFDLWILLEATPGVRRFCERPAYLTPKSGKKALVDFWVQYARHDEFIIVHDEDAPDMAFDKRTRPQLRLLTRTMLSQRATYIKNWRSMLPYIVAHRRWLAETDVATAVAKCGEPMCLGDLERKLSGQDSLWARAVVFTAIAKGRLRAPSLRREPWGLGTVISPSSRHAA